MNKQLPDKIFDFSLQLYHDMTDKVVSDGYVSGVLPESYDLDEVEDKANDLYLLDDIDKPTRKVKLEIKPSSGFCLNLESFISVEKHHLKTPDSFYLINENYLYDSTSPAPTDGKVKDYFKAIELIHKLIKIADLPIPELNPDKLIFLGKQQKLYISLNYAESDLKPLSGLDDFSREFIASNTHDEQKKEIIKSALLEIANGRDQLSIGELFGRFEEFTERVNNNYKLYVAEFSYEKVRSEIVKEKLEAITNLNKVFSDIQNQLLALPAAILIARSQLEQATEVTVKNFMVLGSFFIFSLFMIILIRNQSNTLNAVKSEVDQHKKQLEYKYNGIADRFKDDFKEITSRYRWQKIILWLILLVVVLVFLGILYVFNVYSGNVLSEV